MSADNWTVCPKCKIMFENKQDKLRQQTKDGYGKVSAEEYLSMLTEATKEVVIDNTLREDFWIGTKSDGTFKISYGCSCQRCGFSFKYAYTGVAYQHGKEPK